MASRYVLEFSYQLPTSKYCNSCIESVEPNRKKRKIDIPIVTQVTLALGGWNDSKGDKYSRLVNNPAARARFIEHVIGFIEEHDFDGLDLDWEYPR